MPDNNTDRVAALAIDTLVQAGLVRQVGEMLELTPAGKLFVERTENQDPEVTKQQIKDLLGRS